MNESDLAAAPGFVEPELQAEFPDLRLQWLTVEGGRRPSPPELKLRLRVLSSRYRGGSVVSMRLQPVARAYRTFFRQIGLDPDTTRIPSEQLALARLMEGSFVSRDMVHDARVISLAETGVPVWALDADLVDVSGLGIRTTASGDLLGSGEHARELPPGRLVVADARSVHALLFREVATGHGVGSRTRRITLFTVGVEGVPAIHLEEALWLSVEVIKGTRNRAAWR